VASSRRRRQLHPAPQRTVPECAAWSNQDQRRGVAAMPVPTRSWSTLAMSATRLPPVRTSIG